METWLDCAICQKAVAYSDATVIGTTPYHPECIPDFSIPEISTSRLRALIADPVGWHEREKAMIERSIQDKPKLYWITLSRDEKVSLDVWKKRVQFELRRAHVLNFTAVVEHPKTNIHVHIKMYSKVFLKQAMFDTFNNNYGWVDLSPVGKDNGISQYMEKEGVVTSDPATLFDNLEDARSSPIL